MTGAASIVTNIAKSLVGISATTFSSVIDNLQQLTLKQVTTRFDVPQVNASLFRYNSYSRATLSCC
jgi:hypothetical protein